MATPDAEYTQYRNDALTALTAGDTTSALAAVEAAHQRYRALGRGGTTPSGMPYPSPLDPAFELADAIRSLAESMPIIYSGSATSSTSIAAGGYADIAVQFPAGMFWGAPRVFAIASGYRFVMSVNTLTATGCNLRAANWSTTATAPGTMHFVAILPGQGAAGTSSESDSDSTSDSTSESTSDSSSDSTSDSSSDSGSDSSSETSN